MSFWFHFVAFGPSADRRQGKTIQMTKPDSIADCLMELFIK